MKFGISGLANKWSLLMMYTHELLNLSEHWISARCSTSLTVRFYLVVQFQKPKQVIAFDILAKTLQSWFCPGTEFF